MARRNLGRQDDEWIPEAQKLRKEGLSYGRISRMLDVSEFRVTCALDPVYRERRKNRINSWREKNRYIVMNDESHSRSRRQPSLPRLKCLEKPMPPE